MKILMICKHNRFRSKVAEAIFNKLNKNKENKARSRGIVLDKLRPHVEENVTKIVKEKGYEIKGKPKKFTFDILEDYDLIIIVADNVEKEFFRGFKGKLIQWHVRDTDAGNIGEIKKIVDEVEKKVQGLIENIKV